MILHQFPHIEMSSHESLDSDQTLRHPTEWWRALVGCTRWSSSVCIPEKDIPGLKEGNMLFRLCRESDVQPPIHTDSVPSWIPQRQTCVSQKDIFYVTFCGKWKKTKENSQSTNQPLIVTGQSNCSSCCSVERSVKRKSQIVLQQSQEIHDFQLSD